MSVVAALTGPVPKAGIVVVALLAAAALVVHHSRLRAAAILGAIVLSPALLLGEVWSTSRVVAIRHHPVEAVVAVAAALVIVAILAVAIRARPWLLALLAVVTLPFRVSVSAGGNSADLLVPLYFVIAAGAVAFAVPAIFGRDTPLTEPVPRATTITWLKRLLALVIVLYALQALYSPTVGSPSGFEKALQNMVFFYAPFAVLFCLLERERLSTSATHMTASAPPIAICWCGERS